MVMGNFYPFSGNNEKQTKTNKESSTRPGGSMVCVACVSVCVYVCAYVWCCACVHACVCMCVFLIFSLMVGGLPTKLCFVKMASFFFFFFGHVCIQEFKVLKKQARSRSTPPRTEVGFFPTASAVILKKDNHKKSQLG